MPFFPHAQFSQRLQVRERQRLCGCWLVLSGCHRYWVLSDESQGLKKICQYKATRFLLTLKNEIIPQFLMDERFQLNELERRIKTSYIHS